MHLSFHVSLFSNGNMLTYMVNAHHCLMHSLDNWARFGGAMRLEDKGSLTITSCIFSSNFVKDINKQF